MQSICRCRAGARSGHSPLYLVTDSRPDVCVTTRCVTPAYISITAAPTASNRIGYILDHEINEVFLYSFLLLIVIQESVFEPTFAKQILNVMKNFHL